MALILALTSLLCRRVEVNMAAALEFYKDRESNDIPALLVALGGKNPLKPAPSLILEQPSKL